VILLGRLSACLHDNATNHNTHSATKDIGGVWHAWKSDQRTDRHNSREQTQQRTAGVMEVILPDIEGLETVDHRSIVSVGGRGQDDEHQADVSPSETWISEPGDCGKLSVRKAEGASGWCVHLW